MTDPSHETPATPFRDEDIFRIERPQAELMTYYAIASLMLGPLFFLLLIPSIFRFKTLRYKFDPEGITMSWGILFRREIHLTYARVQDIHLSSNVVERWLGLAKIEIQTASGSTKAEMTLEGLEHAEAVRDFLYSRMRGVSTSPATASADHSSEGAGGEAGGGSQELAAVLQEVAAELRALRQSLPGPSVPGSSGE